MLAWTMTKVIGAVEEGNVEPAVSERLRAKLQLKARTGLIRQVT